MKHNLSRVVVIGNAGAGKTTFAQTLASILGMPHIEMDEIHWGPNWTPRPRDMIREQIEKATSQDRWIFDGNYSMVQEIVWAKATAIVWLNYPFIRVYWRLLRRTLKRIMGREVLFSGNRESFRLLFLSRDSLLWYEIQNYARRRRKFKTLFESGAYPNASLLEFKCPRQTEAFLEMLKKRSEREKSR